MCHQQMPPTQHHNLLLYSPQLQQYKGSVLHHLPSHRDWIFATNTALLPINKWALLVRLNILTGLVLLVHLPSVALALHQPP
jgi:hypothetical protein